ncbi:MAG: PBP1A family penicillin-binding protein [Alphaproteobacteria bacterium]|nr:PBP1A family penicillin-binding protein [Alphaproteobacteria bacterium]
MAKRATSKPKSKAKPKRSSRASGKKTARAKKSRKPLLLLLKWSLVATIWGTVILGVLVAWFAWGLPSIDGLEPTAAQTRRPGVVLRDTNGGRLASYGDLYGRRLGARELPPHLIQAVVAIEDRRFFEHPGFDGRGVLRAMLVNLREGRFVQGGSTLTQQLAKNLFLTPERSIQRKVKELILALSLERRFEKEDLLSIYLNRVYLGSGTYGVEAAAQRYFGISARDIDVYQAALLAGLLRAPSRLNPAHDLAAARQRTDTVLNAMVEAGFVTNAEARDLKRRGALAQLRRADAQAAAAGGADSGASRRYFADWVLGQAAGIAGRSNADLQVETTLSPRLQGLAARVIGKVDTGGAQVALVAMTPRGEVCAMVGGRNYAKSQFNRATQALRQPGSAFKPMVYLPALEAGMTPDTPVLDAPITIDGWTPRNFSGDFHGEVTLREAVARSFNTTAVRVAEDIGRDNVLQAARRLGITSELTGHPSVSLGAGEVTLLELTAAYAVFANGGAAVSPFGLVEVRAGDDVLFRHRRRADNQIVASEHVAAMDHLLRAVVDWGTGRAAAFGRSAAGKTGTSQGSRDAWFIGYTDRLVTGVWIGNDDSSPMGQINQRSMAGGGVPADIWREFMRAAHESPARGCR